MFYSPFSGVVTLAPNPATDSPVDISPAAISLIASFIHHFPVVSPAAVSPARVDAFYSQLLCVFNYAAICR